MLDLSLVDKNEVSCHLVNGEVDFVATTNDFTLSGLTYFFRLVELYGDNEGKVKVCLYWLRNDGLIFLKRDWIVENNGEVLKSFFNSINFELNL